MPARIGRRALFPHAQHIHAGARGECPSPGDDADGNGVVDTPEGQPAYGPVVVSLTEEGGETGHEHVLDVGNFPTGGSTSYSRTIDLGEDAQTDEGTINPAEEVRAGNAVIVIHGLNPAIMPGETALEVSRLSDDFPLAATAPALCGVLNETGDGTFTAQLSPTNVVAQVDAVPGDGVATGGGSTATTQQPALLYVLAVIGLAGVAALGLAISRRSAGQS